MLVLKDMDEHEINSLWLLKNVMRYSLPVLGAETHVWNKDFELWKNDLQDFF